MKDAPPPLLNRVARKLRSLGMRSQLDAYLGSMAADNPLRGLPARIVGDASSDPTEFFTHYDGFAYWVATKLAHANRGGEYSTSVAPKPKTQCCPPLTR